ncbi:MAG TPA: hemolysin family protein [Candidatus Babeliales bacterium]|jgi:putative hemolysin|nr:hemolysin family protein [Candidatus Babeliales bacterium]
MEPYQLNQLITPFILLCIALSFRAVLSFLETSITALRLFRLKELAHTTTQYLPLLQTLERNPQRVLITILVANSFIDVTAASLATFIMSTIFTHIGFSGGIGFTFGVTFASIGIVVFGEILPKSFAKIRSEQAFKSVLWLINCIYYTLYPFVIVLVKFSDYVMYKIGGKDALESSSQWISSEREIQFLINYIHEKGLLELEKREMLQNVFEIGSTPVKEVMMPGEKIISLEVHTSMDEVCRFFREHSYTRIPVYEEKQDNIIGMVHQKDLFFMLSRGEAKLLRDIIRPIMFVLESMKVIELLGKFREKQIHIAMVINEQGMLTGLVTLEDLIEEIVGEISDEHESIVGKIMPMGDNEWLVDATITLEDLGKFLDITFVTEGAVSLAGFLAERLQHIPQKDEELLYNDFLFQVQKATALHVQFVHVSKKH